VSVDLDHDPLPAPQEVDLVAVEDGVRLRRWQPGAADQRQQATLAARPGAGRIALLEQAAEPPCAATARVTVDQRVELVEGRPVAALGLGEEVLEVVPIERCGQVEHGPGRGGGRDPVEDLAFVGFERADSVDRDSPTRPGIPTHHRDMYRGWLGR
jgi:hypothetical protein